MARIAKRSVISHSHKGMKLLCLCFLVKNRQFNRLCDDVLFVFSGTCTPYVTDFLKEEKKDASLCKVTRSTNGMYEVNLITTGAPDIHIPPEPDQPGRKKVTKADKKRKKGVNESPTKKQPKHKKRIMHCGICGQPDHNSRFHTKNKVCFTPTQVDSQRWIH